MLFTWVLPAGTDFLVYTTPVGFAFITWLVDVHLQPAWNRAQRAVGVLAVAAALLRAVTLVPFYSGHALFLSFALATAAQQWTRLVAGLVLLQVTWMKIQWQDATVVGGVLLGALAGWGFRRAGPGQ